MCSRESQREGEAVEEIITRKHIIKLKVIPNGIMLFLQLRKTQTFVLPIMAKKSCVRPFGNILIYLFFKKS